MPQGATPRSLVIHLRGTLTRTCKPGDSVTVAGVFLPQPYTGFRAMRAGLLTTTYLDAMSVTQDKRSYKDTAADGTLRAQIEVPLPCCWALCQSTAGLSCGTGLTLSDFSAASAPAILQSLIRSAEVPEGCRR